MTSIKKPVLVGYGLLLIAIILLGSVFILQTQVTPTAKPEMIQAIDEPLIAPPPPPPTLPPSTATLTPEEPPSVTPETIPLMTDPTQSSTPTLADIPASPLAPPPIDPESINTNTTHTYESSFLYPYSNSTILDAVELLPSDPLPRTITLDTETITITRIDVEDGADFTIPQLGYVGLTLTTNSGETIRYYYSPDQEWLPGFGCIPIVKCGNAHSGALNLWQRTAERTATLAGLQASYPDTGEATITEWVNDGYITTSYYYIKVGSFVYNSDTRKWNSIRLILERIDTPSAPTIDN